MKPAPLAWFALSLAIVSACKRGAGVDGPVVARGKGVVVTAAAFQAKLNEQSPAVRARYAPLDRKKEFLENLIRFQLLASEARRQKLEQDPEVQETIERILVQRLVKKAFDEAAGASTSDDALKAYYEAHHDEFVKPERVRVSQIMLRTPRGAPDHPARLTEARKILARLKAEEAKNPLAFASVAREVSEDAATKASGGDLGLRSRDEIEQALGGEVAQAAFALKSVGDESAIVESAQGLHLLVLTGRQPAVSRSIDEVKPQLAARLGREHRAHDFDAFVKKLRDDAGIEISDAALERISVTAAPAAAQP